MILIFLASGARWKKHDNKQFSLLRKAMSDVRLDSFNNGNFHLMLRAEVKVRILRCQIRSQCKRRGGVGVQYGGDSGPSPADSESDLNKRAMPNTFGDL